MRSNLSSKTKLFSIFRKNLSDCRNIQYLISLGIIRKARTNII
nr:MAG TPA: hypothetical protein [Caudoviricetes sp.]